MSTKHFLRAPVLKLCAVAAMVGLIAVPEARAMARVSSRAANVTRPAAMKLAKAKKRKKSSGSKDTGDSGAEDTAAAGDDAGGSAGGSDDQESSLLSPRKKAAKADREAAKPDREETGSTAASSDDDDGGGGGKTAKPKVVMESSAPEPSEEATNGAAGTALEFGVGGMALIRQLVWTSDAQKAGLGPYTLPVGPEAGLWLEFYPAAFVTSGFASNIGLYARYAYGFGVTSRTDSNANVATSYQDFVAGLKVRVPLGTLTPYGSVAYGEQQFSLAPQGNAADLPAMDYSFVRIGLGTRVQFTPSVGLDAGVGFLTVTNPGSGLNQLASQSYFPKTAAYAVDAGASLAIRLASKVGIRVGFDFRQYGMAFNPQAGASKVVTGAVDRYMVAWSGLEVLVDGAGSGDGSSGAAPAPKQRHRTRHADPDEDESSTKESSTDE